MRHHAIGSGSHLGCDDDVLKKARRGRLQVPVWDRRLIGLLFAGGIIVCCFPISMPGAKGTPNRLVRGGHDASTLSIAFSPDGTSMATTHGDGRVAIRDMASGWGVRRTLKDRDHCRVAAYSPDGSLALGGVESDIVLCDPRSDGAERRLGMPMAWTSAIASSHDGRILAASSHSRTEIILWDVNSGSQWKTLKGQTSPAISLAFSPDGRSLAAGGARDERVIIWDTESGEPKWQLRGVPGPIASIAYSPDGRLLASLNAHEKRVRLWETSTGRLIRLVAEESPSTTAVAFSPDGGFLATAEGDGTAGLWNVETGRRVGKLDAQSARLTALAFSPDGQTLAAVGVNNDIRFWDVAAFFRPVTEP